MYFYILKVWEKLLNFQKTKKQKKLLNIMELNYYVSNHLKCMLKVPNCN